MAKKTKEQKIAADQRRESIQYSLPNINKSKVFSESKIVAPINDYTFVIKDLKKIGLFTLLAFGAEIALKVILQNR